MSFLFGNICARKRGKELFYCFLEATEKLFSSVNANSLRTAIHFLGIIFLTCTEEEYIFCQQHLTSEFAPFLLLSEQNLLRMYRLILDFKETANFDFRFPRATSYQWKSNLALGDSQSAVRELKIATFSGRRRPDWQSNPGTEVAVASLQNSNIKIAVNSGGRRRGGLPKRKI